MADASSPLLPPPGKSPSPATAARFARCASSANDELRSFRACLAWLCVDHSSSTRVAAVGSWAVFLLLAVAAPAAVRLLPLAAASATDPPPPPRPFDGQVQVSLTLAATLAYVSLRALLHRAGGLRRLLYLDSLRRDSEDVQAGYAAQLARSFRVLACFVLPCALAEAAYKAYWYRAAVQVLGSRTRWWWAAAACAVEVASWVYRVALFFMVCVLFRVICYLQVLRMVGFAREFRRRARAVLDQPGGGSAHVPVQRGEDHAQDAGDDERGGGVARGRHGARLRQLPGEPGQGPAPHVRLPGARQRLPRGRRRRVRQRRRRRRQPLLPGRPQVRAVPGQQHQLPKEAGAGDVPGEQPGGDHGVRLRGGPGVAARALHDRVLTRHVAARQDRRHLLNSHPSFARLAPVTQVQSFRWRNCVQNE